MNKAFVFSLIFTCSFRMSYAQPAIVSCPLDTNAIFEIAFNYYQLLDSSGRIQTKIQPGWAIPHWYEPKAFMNRQTNEPCTPFNIEFEDNKIYVYDSTGHYPYYAHPDSANRFELNQDNIKSLRINIVNETKETIHLNDIPFLSTWDLAVVYLEIACNCYYLESRVKIDAKNWEFLKPEYLMDLKIYATPAEGKKKLLKDLGKFENLQVIELR
ncbi:MAG: hypothetical protein NXI10_13225 [bacterium]|nr:hypothetical protein [bacterium]